MAQNITLMGAFYLNVPKVRLPKNKGGDTADFTDVTDTTATASDVSQGKYFYTANGTRTQGTNTSSTSMNVQCYHGMKSVASGSYSATGVSITVAKSGTYKVSWMGCRNTNSGTSGSQLYINNSAYGTAQTTFTSTYGQSVTLTDVSLTAGQTVEVRARSRGTGYVMMVGQLCIEQTE